ncbi:MAG: hypothetical protein HXX16_20280 [Bacteroidales bacterium]|nr:hypothetical protein [Bacteroidales bacterium]
MQNGKTISVLITLIVIFSTIATISGILTDYRTGNYEFKSINNQTVTIYGKGIAQGYVTLSIAFIITIISFFLISVFHGIQREYRFEVAVISIAQIELILLGFLFTKYFKKITKIVQIKNV